MNYTFDVRSPEEARQCFEEGKHNGLATMQGIVKYCLGSSLGASAGHCAVIGYEDNTAHEVFVESGEISREYAYDFKVFMIDQNMKRFECHAEMKTTPARLDEVWVKRNQLDNLIKKYSNPIVIASDPYKFMIMNAKKFKEQAILQEVEKAGNKMMYVVKGEQWIHYPTKLEFIKLRGV